MQVDLRGQRKEERGIQERKWILRNSGSMRPRSHTETLNFIYASLFLLLFLSCILYEAKE